MIFPLRRFQISAAPAAARRRALMLGLAALAAGTDFSPAQQQQRLRIMTGNISSGNQQSYDSGEGARIFQGLKPDVVLIQEFNYSTGTAAAIRTFVDTTFGTSFAYYREGGAQIPNGVISRYPILESGEWDDPKVTNRDFAWARIDIPGDRDLWAVSVHFLTTSATNRNDEAQALKTFIAGKVPAADYLVIGGDFNCDSRNEALFTSLAGTVITSAPWPADKNGNVNTNASRAKPYDGVYVDTDLNALKTSVIVGGSTFANGLVADTRVYTPISEIAPAMAADSGANQMQHMAVVKDFLLPPPADPPALPLISSEWGLHAEPAWLRLTFASTPGAPYEIQASGTMAQGNWQPLGQITAATGMTPVRILTAGAADGEFSDVLLGVEPRRFYRIVRK
ncbi:MAG: endonuclease/exonuclease/phosphatase family protein [Verrucomicrobiota bacterium]